MQKRAVGLVVAGLSSIGLALGASTSAYALDLLPGSAPAHGQSGSTSGSQWMAGLTQATMEASRASGHTSPGASTVQNMLTGTAASSGAAKLPQAANQSTSFLGMQVPAKQQAAAAMPVQSAQAPAVQPSSGQVSTKWQPSVQDPAKSQVANPVVAAPQAANPAMSVPQVAKPAVAAPQAAKPAVAAPQAAKPATSVYQAPMSATPATSAFQAPRPATSVYQAPMSASYQSPMSASPHASSPSIGKHQADEDGGQLQAQGQGQHQSVELTVVVDNKVENHQDVHNTNNNDNSTNVHVSGVKAVEEDEHGHEHGLKASRDHVRHEEHGKHEVAADSRAALAHTGSDELPLVLGAGALVGTGVVLMRMRRVRRS